MGVELADPIRGLGREALPQVRTFKYRVTHRSAEGAVVLRGRVRTTPNADTDHHIRGRILSDIAKDLEFEWVEIYEEQDGKAVA